MADRHKYLSVRERIARASANHPYRPRRSFAPPLMHRHNNLFDRAASWLLPWTRRTYPGLYNGLLEVPGGGYSLSSIRGWLSGHRRLPGPVAARFAVLIRARSDQGYAIAAELDRYAAAWVDGRRTPKGFCVVRDRDRSGAPRDARNKLGGRPASCRR